MDKNLLEDLKLHNRIRFKGGELWSVHDDCWVDFGGPKEIVVEKIDWTGGEDITGWVVGEPNHHVYGSDDCFEGIQITPELLLSKNFVENEHIYPYPCYEYRNEEHKFLVRYAFCEGSPKTKRKRNFIEIDAEQAETNVPCNYYHEFQNALKSCEIDEYMDF